MRHSFNAFYITDRLRVDIELIINNRKAYVTAKGNVYFDVQKDLDYGRLVTKKNLDRDGARIQNEEDKKYWRDFALWKSNDDELSRMSPWGLGRPGWHMECSTMSRK